MGGDLSKQTGPVAEALLAGGRWPEGSPAHFQEIADRADAAELATEEPISNMKFAAESWNESATGDVFHTAGQGMTDEGAYMGASGTFMGDKYGLLQKTALALQSAQADVDAVVTRATPEIQKAWDENDTVSANRLISQYQGAIDQILDGAATTMANDNSQHFSSSPEPRYTDNTTGVPVTDSYSSDRAGETLNPVAPSQLSTYNQASSAAAPAGSPMSSPATPSQGISSASAGLDPSGAPSAAPTTQPAQAAAAPAAAGAGAAPSQAGARTGGGPGSGQGGATQLMSGTAAAAPTLPEAKGLSNESVGRASGGVAPGGIAGVPVANTATPPPASSQPPSPPASRVSVTAPNAPASPVAAQAGATSGGGSLARPGAATGSGGPPPPPSAAKLTTGPAPEPARAESAAAIAQRTGKPYELASDGVLRAEMHPYLQAAYGVVRLAAAQSRNYVMELDGDVSAAREVGEVDWSCGVFEPLDPLDSPVPVFVLASDLLTSLVPPTNKWDPGVVNPCAKEARVRKDTWVASCSDPTAAVIEYHGVLQADRRDDLLRLTYLVTTRTADPGETVRTQLRLRETEYVVYKPDPGELTDVEVNADFLRHRITLLDSSLAYVAGIDKLPRKKFLGLGLALAREAVEQTKGWAEGNGGLLTGILDTLQRGEEPEEDEWVEAQLLVANRIGEARKHSVTDRPLPVLNLEGFGGGSIDPTRGYIGPFLQAMAAQTVFHLRRLFDLWDETVGEVLADIVYDTHAATGELQRVREIVDEHLADYRDEKIPA